MMDLSLAFTFRSGIPDIPFDNVRLCGSWDGQGRPSSQWTTWAMETSRDAEGFGVHRAQVAFPQDCTGETYAWGVVVDGPAGRDLWAIAAEIDDIRSAARERRFVLRPDTPEQSYFLTWIGRLGAVRLPESHGRSGIRFSLWAPNATAVDLVLADPAVGYVANDGTGMVRSIAMTAQDGIWSAGPADDPGLADFENMVGTPYIYRITKDDGSIAFRTDIWSLMQVGAGDFDPGGAAYAGPPEMLDGPQSCSVVCDPGRVVIEPGQELSAEAFWADEFTDAKPLATGIEDLVIYELHVGALGFGKDGPGTLDDAIAFLDHLTELGVNAIELMPIAEFETRWNWGYGTSHFFAMEQGAGGTDRLKAFVKACHQRGIVVLLDVCYNHFDPDGERAEWAYDSNDPTRNIYYWYEGSPDDYARSDGGYVDNLSTGWAPSYHQEAVRQLFVSSAAFLVTTCHVDGFRLDQTSSIHEYPVRHADGQRVEAAAAFGVKFLKQWTRTMRLIKPSLFLTAEDYSNWPAMTAPSLEGEGLGFDATWYGDFHHGLMEYKGGPQAQLVRQAGYGDDRPLALSSFAGALMTSGQAKVVYNQSHDDCGNREGSARTLPLAVDFAPLVGETRRWAEARARLAAALTLLCAGTPMFFMGEEIGATKPYRYDDFKANREDILADAAGQGAALFRYYCDIVAFSVGEDAIRSRNIDIADVHDANRVIAFHRWNDADHFLVVASLANAPFSSGYVLHDARLADFGWQEVFNSDARAYGGWNVGNAGSVCRAERGALNVVLPASGVLVFKRS